MRRATSRTPSRVAVVGAGFAGLSAALHLRGAGCEVTVLEAASAVGGLAVSAVHDTPSGTWRLDTGPTVLTLPEVADDALRAVGDRLDARLRMHRLDPAYEARFADGSVLPVSTDGEVMAERIAALVSPAEADAYRRHVTHLRALFRAEHARFVDHNHDSPAGLLGVELGRLVAMGAFGRLAAQVERAFDDDRLRRLFSFQALYAGVSPRRALGLYAVISYLDLVHGVFYPEGGMSALPEALAAAARDAGVEIRCDTRATGIERSADRVLGARTEDGLVGADAVVLTCDPGTAAALLGVDRLRGRPTHWSPSAVVLAAGTRGWEPPSAHHTIAFGHSWHEVFDDLESGRLMRDPSVLLSVPSRTDPGLAPTGAHTAYALLPVPSLATGPDEVAWARLREPVRRHLLDTLARRGLGDLAASVVVEELISPADWLERGNPAGTPFSAAHTWSQTGPFRSGNILAPGVVHAGAHTTPGVGVPITIISGRLAAERLTGPRPGYRSLAWP